jgi:hypothetical protein
MINKTKLIIFDIGGVLRAPEQSFELLLDDLANAVGTPPEKVREFYAHYWIGCSLERSPRPNSFWR